MLEREKMGLQIIKNLRVQGHMQMNGVWLSKFFIKNDPMENFTQMHVTC